MKKNITKEKGLGFLGKAALLCMALLLSGASALRAQTTTYYFADTHSISGAATIWDLSSSAPTGGADDTTSVNLLVGALGAYQFIPGVNNNAVLSVLSGFSGGGWETPALTGTLPSGNITFNVKIANAGLVSAIGAFQARLLAGSNTNGSNAVTLSNWIVSPNLLTLLANQTQTDSFQVNLASPVALNNQHLFVQVAWDCTVAAAFGVTFVTDESAESMVIPSIQSFTATPTYTFTTVPPTSTPTTPASTATYTFTTVPATSTPTYTHTSVPPTSTSTTPASTATYTSTVPAATATYTSTTVPATSTSTYTSTSVPATSTPTTPASTATYTSTVSAGTPTFTATVLSTTGTGASQSSTGGGYPTSYTPDGVFGATHNSFDPATTTITFYYNVPQSEHVKMALYNVLGLPVKQLIDNDLPAGVWSVDWNGCNDYGSMVASDVYFVLIKLGNTSYLRKVAVVRRTK